MHQALHIKSTGLALAGLLIALLLSPAGGGQRGHDFRNFNTVHAVQLLAGVRSGE